MKLRRAIVSAALFVLSLSLATPAQQADTASGTLTVNGKAVQLNHAFARVFKNNPDDADKYVEVLLSAEPVDPLVAASSNSLRGLAREGKLTGIQVTLDQEKHPVDITAYSPAISDGYIPASKNKEFDAETFDDHTVAGRLYTTEEGSFFDDRYEYDVKFRAAIAPDPFSITPADRAALAALKPGAATGSFKVNDKETKFQYAYAVGRRDFPGDPEKLALVLSDAPIPEDVLLGAFGMQKLAREGTVHAVEVELKDGQPEGGQLYHQEFSKGEPEGTSFSVSVSGMHNFVPETVDANHVSGKLFMKGPSDFMDTTYYYTATFRADMLRKPPPTYEGAKAALSGPGKVVTSFMSAARLGNKLALKKVVTPQMAAQLDGPDGKMILAMAKGSFPLGMKVVEVTEKGASAEVVAMKRSKSGRETVRLHAIKIDGQWKVGQEGGEEKPAPPREPPTPEQIAAAKTGPGKALLAFADAIHEKDVAKMKALSANPAEFKDMQGPFADMALSILAAAFPWDLRITRVTQSGNTALVEAESAQIKEPLKVDMVLIKGVWKIAAKPKQP